MSWRFEVVEVPASDVRLVLSKETFPFMKPVIPKGHPRNATWQGEISEEQRAQVAAVPEAVASLVGKMFPPTAVLNISLIGQDSASGLPEVVSTRVVISIDQVSERVYRERPIQMAETQGSLDRDAAVVQPLRGPL